MSITYRKLWMKLAEKEIKKCEFQKELKSSSNTLSKLGKNKPVSMDVLIKICTYLHCSFGDIVEMVYKD